MALTVNNKMFVSWADIEDLVQELWKKVVIGSMPVNSIHGLKRGGYIPAVMLSHQLSLPYSEIIYPDTLVVDDICDSGETLKKAPGVYHAVLHYKPHTSCVIPTIWAKEVGDDWIVYPWEKNDSRAIQDYKL
tara:strand:- start:157 stop:552 length:396 start_codon:yes stop_codon:yes gene_type:complete